MKFYLESVRLDEVKQAYEEFRIDGVVIPAASLLGDTGSFASVLRGVSEWAGGMFTRSGDYFDFPILADISSELDRESDAVALVLKLRAISPFFVVSLPCSSGGVRLAYRLRDEAVPVNMNRVLTPMQAVWAARCGAVSVSTSVGAGKIYGERVRLCVRKIADTFRNYSFMSEIVVPVAASVGRVEEAILGGADVVACKLELYQKGLESPFF